MIEAVKARTREQIDKVSELEASARMARLRYQHLLKQSAGTLDQEMATVAKTELATAEANLAEGQGILQGLQRELPQLQTQMPSAADVDAARRAAWEAIWMDLRQQVPKEMLQLVTRTYAALLAYKNDAPYATALASLFPDPPTRQECARLTEEMAREYSIPL
jgi:hypothetical protein